MAKYAKFIVAILGAILAGITVFADIDLAGKGITAEVIWNFLVPILTAIGVYAVPNSTNT